VFIKMDNRGLETQQWKQGQRDAVLLGLKMEDRDGKSICITHRFFTVSRKEHNPAGHPVF
jgi:hypothetical protein